MTALAPASLSVAADIGDRLAASAIWHEDRCTWIGAPPDPRAGRLRLRTVEADLYAGTAGIALFLAELAHVAQPSAANAARGAMRHSLRRAAEIRQSMRLSLYCGWLGIALAAARVARLLDDPVIAMDARELFTDAVIDDLPSEPDLLSGTAGAVVACLGLYRLTDDERLLHRAVALGDHLIATAEREASGWSWRAHGIRTVRNLTGLSHGASGIGLALLELAGVAEAGRFRAAAREAFAYEAHWFDARAQNWPDFRSNESPGRARTSTFGGHWCHGAPGIGLARVRAVELGEVDLAGEAVIAFATTTRLAEAMLADPRADFTPCHGLVGLAEILSRGLALAPRGDETVARIVDVGAQRGAAGRWPCGVGDEEAPGMFLGLAGIGRFYLGRTAGPLPSLLAFESDGWGTLPRSSSRAFFRTGVASPQLLHRRMCDRTRTLAR